MSMPDLTTPQKVVRWSYGNRHETIAVPTPFDSQRAAALLKDGIDSVVNRMTDGEQAYVSAVWKTLPSHTCWMDAFYLILNNRVQQQKRKPFRITWKPSDADTTYSGIQFHYNAETAADIADIKKYDSGAVLVSVEKLSPDDWESIQNG